MKKLNKAVFLFLLMSVSVFAFAASAEQVLAAPRTAMVNQLGFTEFNPGHSIARMGPVRVGESVSQRLGVFNIGDEPLQVDRIRLTNLGIAGGTKTFGLKTLLFPLGQSFPVTLQPGEKLHFIVTFKPTFFPEQFDFLTARIDVDSNDPFNPTFTSSVKGFVLDGPVVVPN